VLPRVVGFGWHDRPDRSGTIAADHRATFRGACTPLWTHAITVPGDRWAP